MSGVYPSKKSTKTQNYTFLTTYMIGTGLMSLS